MSLESDFFGASGTQDAGAVGLGDLEKRLDREEFCLITVGRALISDPGWVGKIKAGQAQQLRGFDAADLAELIGAEKCGFRTRSLWGATIINRVAGG